MPVFFENVADRIARVLTPEMREAILQIKSDIPTDEQVMSILVYQAVIEGGIRDIHDFRQWQKQNPNRGIITWLP